MSGKLRYRARVFLFTLTSPSMTEKDNLLLKYCFVETLSNLGIKYIGQIQSLAHIHTMNFILVLSYKHTFMYNFTIIMFCHIQYDRTSTSRDSRARDLRKRNTRTTITGGELQRMSVYHLGIVKVLASIVYM